MQTVKYFDGSFDVVIFMFRFWANGLLVCLGCKATSLTTFLFSAGAHATVVIGLFVCIGSEFCSLVREFVGCIRDLGSTSFVFV